MRVRVFIVLTAAAHIGGTRDVLTRNEGSNNREYINRSLHDGCRRAGRRIRICGLSVRVPQL